MFSYPRRICMDFYGKIAIIRQGVDIPPFHEREEEYARYNSYYEGNGFNFRLTEDDYPIAVVIKRATHNKNDFDMRNIFRYNQHFPEYGITFPKVIPRSLIRFKKEGDIVKIENFYLDFELVCCQYKYQTPEFIRQFGLTSFERMYELEESFRRKKENECGRKRNCNNWR